MDQYNEHRGRMKTGDVLLFSGAGLISNLIKFATGSPWSHVAMVMVDERYDFVTSLESTTLSVVPDLTTGRPMKGVQLVPLSQRIETYEGEVAWRPVDAPRDDGTLRRMFDVRREFMGRPYEKNQLELLRSALDWSISPPNQPDTSSIFCSELVALAWQAAWWLEDVVPENERTPADFAGNPLGLARNVTLGDCVMLKGEMPS